MKKNYFLPLFCVVLLGCSSPAPKVALVAYPSTPEQAIEALIAGNHRFMVDSCISPHHDTKRMKETAPHQSPFVAIIGCSDSRVPQELIFDQGIGDIFAIRIAGNNVNDNHVMGSVEYAANHLGVKAIVVLGHTHCGGLTAAITPVDPTAHHTSESHLDSMLLAVRRDVAEYIGKPEELSQAIYQHTTIQVQKVLALPEIAKLVANGTLKVVGAIYDIETGAVTLQ